MSLFDPVQLIPLVISINTVALMWLVGDRRILGWVLGVCGQAAWFVFIVVFDAWGLLPLATVLTVVYVRNLIKWTHENRRKDNYGQNDRR